MASDRIEQGVTGNFLLAFQIRHDRVIRRFFDAFDFLVQPQRDAAVPQMVTKRFDHLGIGEFQQARTFFNQRHAHAQRGEHAHILDADDSAAHNDHGLGNHRHLQNLIAVDDGRVVERDQGRDGGFRARGENDVACFKLDLSARARHLHVVRI